MIIDRGETHAVGARHAYDPSDGAKNPPPATEFDRDRYRITRFPFYAGTMNPTGFAHCEIWVNSEPKLILVSPTNEGSFEQVSTNPPAYASVGGYTSAVYFRHVLRPTTFARDANFWIFVILDIAKAACKSSTTGISFRQFTECTSNTLASCQCQP